MGIAFSPDSTPSSCHGGHRAKLWRVDLGPTTGKQLVKLPGHDWMALPGLQPRWPSDRHGEPRRGGQGLRDIHRSIDPDPQQKAGRTTSVVFSPDDRYLAAAGADGSIKVWDTTSWSVATRSPRTPAEPSGWRTAPTVVGSPRAGRIRQQDLVRRPGELLSLRGHLGEVNAVAEGPDGKRLASASGGHTIKIGHVMPGPDAGP